MYIMLIPGYLANELKNSTNTWFITLCLV
jgi:hypothetical protein